MEHSAHAGHTAASGTPSSAAATYNINFQVTVPPIAGAESELSFVVTEQKVGEPLESFELLHDRLMHRLARL